MHIQYFKVAASITLTEDGAIVTPEFVSGTNRDDDNVFPSQANDTFRTFDFNYLGGGTTIDGDGGNNNLLDIRDTDGENVTPQLDNVQTIQVRITSHETPGDDAELNLIDAPDVSNLMVTGATSQENLTFEELYQDVSLTLSGNYNQNIIQVDYQQNENSEFNITLNNVGLRTGTTIGDHAVLLDINEGDTEIDTFNIDTGDEGDSRIQTFQQVPASNQLDTLVISGQSGLILNDVLHADVATVDASDLSGQLSGPEAGEEEFFEFGAVDLTDEDGLTFTGGDGGSYVQFNAATLKKEL